MKGTEGAREPFPSSPSSTWYVSKVSKRGDDEEEEQFFTPCLRPLFTHILYLFFLFAACNLRHGTWRREGDRENGSWQFEDPTHGKCMYQVCVSDPWTWSPFFSSMGVETKFVSVSIPHFVLVMMLGVSNMYQGKEEGESFLMSSISMAHHGKCGPCLQKERKMFEGGLIWRMFPQRFVDTRKVDSTFSFIFNLLIHSLNGHHLSLSLIVIGTDHHDHHRTTWNKW